MYENIFSFINKLTFNFYLFIIILYNFFYVIILVGVSNKQQVIYLAKGLNAFIHCFIALFLIIRFNPFYEKKHILNENDTSLIFGSGIFLLVNLGIFQILESNINNRLFGWNSTIQAPLRE